MRAKATGSSINSRDLIPGANFSGAITINVLPIQPGDSLRGFLPCRLKQPEQEAIEAASPKSMI
jgi:hypothetical protein